MQASVTTYVISVSESSSDLLPRRRAATTELGTRLCFPGSDLLQRPARVFSDFGIVIIRDQGEKRLRGWIGNLAQRCCSFLAQICLLVRDALADRTNRPVELHLAKASDRLEPHLPEIVRQRGNQLVRR